MATFEDGIALHICIGAWLICMGTHSPAWPHRSASANRHPFFAVRHVSVMIITLSKTAQNVGSPGYQAPLPKELVQPLALAEDADDPLAVELEARGEGRARGGR